MTDAAAALAWLATAQPLDLLLTDVGLPGMTGRELAARAQGLRPSLKVLLLTGYAREATVRSDFLGEGMDMMSKPFDIDELATRVRQLIHP